MNRDRCYRGGNMHKYVPRYTEVETSKKIDADHVTGEQMRALLYYNKYVYDI